RRADLDLGSHSYHNAGLMLIDLRGWRDNNIGSKILSYYQNKNGQLFANDQDAINGGVKEYIKTLSIAYNYFNIYDTYPYKTLEKLSSPANFIH
ncbi:glycosyltransferase, partial [Streptococcus suis]|uniref:glycosyltransferase n=1 Tax=Streptococcus suis TaxID=1307 RepID=UPI002ED663DC